jgi:TPR repeat protein
VRIIRGGKIRCLTAGRLFHATRKSIASSREKFAGTWELMNREIRTMAKFLNNWILALVLAALMCAGCKQSNSKDVSQMSVAELQAAANQGNTQAMVALGLDYDNGKGLIQDFGEAKEWYQKAAQSGDSWGELRLGYCYFVGRGVKQNFPEAVKWFRLAADAGQPGAQVILGEAYVKGLGIEKKQQRSI